jgi:hypothetical protein
MREAGTAMLIVLSLLATDAVHGQSQSQPRPEFEVASVKPLPPSSPMFPAPTGGPGTSDPGHITWSGTTLKWMLKTAYDVRLYQISGPEWIDSNQYMYTIAAKLPEGATREQVNLMWQELLKDRFGVVVHHESRGFQGEEITLPKDASKLKETDFQDSAAAPNSKAGRDDDLHRFLPTPGLIVAGGGGNRRIRQPAGRERALRELCYRDSTRTRTQAQAGQGHDSDRCDRHRSRRKGSGCELTEARGPAPSEAIPDSAT